MVKNPYKTLDVDEKADKKAIKAAYRKAAKKNHPDTGGDSKKFALVKKAHDILMDDARRAKYDNSGDESEKSPDNALGDVINCLAFHFNAVLQKCADSGDSPLETDMIIRIRHSIDRSLDDARKQLRITKGVLATDKKLSGRFKKKEGDGNVFEGIISHRISSLHISIANFEKTIKTHEEALKMVNGFSYESDEKPYESPGDKMMSRMGVSFYSGWP